MPHMQLAIAYFYQADAHILPFAHRLPQLIYNHFAKKMCTRTYAYTRAHTQIHTHACTPTFFVASIRKQELEFPVAPVNHLAAWLLSFRAQMLCAC